MTSETVTGQADSQRVWHLIERDFTLRLSLVTEDWATDYLKAWNSVFAEGKRRGNSAYFGPALIDMALDEMDKRARWSYQTCCEIWQMQGRSKSRPFFQAIFDWCLQPMFAVRKGCFTHQLELHKMRARTSIAPNRSHIDGHMVRQMGKLKARWNTILEIAIREAENEERLNREQALSQTSRTNLDVHAQISAHRIEIQPGQPLASSKSHPETVTLGSPFTWRELEIRFQQVQENAPPRYKVHVHLVRTEWHSGAVGEEWSVGGDLASQKEFESLASISAQKLGHYHGETVYKEWLGCVRKWLRETGLDKDRSFVWLPIGTYYDGRFTNSTKTLFSERIAELSAKYCMNLMARGTPESSVSHRPEPRKTGELDSKPLASGRKAGMTRKQLRKTSVIFGAIQLGLKGPEYCAALDDRKLVPGADWLEEGCPSTYSEAYKDARWRKRIHDEKCTYREKYDDSSDQQREAIIQGQHFTRRTRQ